MIVIEKPFIKELKKKTRLLCDIIVDGEKRRVYLEVDKEYGKYLCYERCDAFLIVLFFYAMISGHDIICKSMVSEDLYYQITEYLIPLFQRNSYNKLKMINITCKTATNVKNIGAVGTGITCGVDSFYTIFNNINNPLNSKKLTHLVIMSLADSYKKNGQYKRVTKALYSKATRVSKKLGLPIVKLKSNMRELFPIPPMHTLIRMYGVYALQKLFGVYYFSSGYPIWTFNLEDCSLIDSARYDLLLCKELTTKNLFIYSDGSQMTRLDKLKFIANYDIVRKNLHVCVNDSYNCGVCSKCVRTITAIDSINCLDDFKSVFNINYYEKNRDYYFKKIVEMYNSGDLFIFDFVDDLIKKYTNNKILKTIGNNKMVKCERCYRLSDYNIHKKNTKQLIGIIGSSGSGKSTVSHMLAELLDDSEVIDVDEYMIKYLDVYKKKIIETLNIPSDGRHWCNYIYNSFDDVKAWSTILKVDIEKCIQERISKCCSKTIIIDSFILPLFDIFKACKYKILIKSDEKLELARIKMRLRGNGRLQLFDDMSLKNRVKYTKTYGDEQRFDFVIKNNQTIEILMHDVRQVVNKIEL